MAIEPKQINKSVGARWIQPVIAFVVYLGIALAFFSQVWGQLADSTIGDGYDNIAYLWVVWWFKQSLFAGANPYYCDLLFAPYGTPLVLTALAPIQCSLMTILNYFLKIEIAYNIVIIAAFPIAGIGAYALCRYITKDHIASIIGGLAFMLSPFVVSKCVPGWLNMLYCGFLPMYFACLLKSTEFHTSKPSRWPRYLLAATVFLILFSSIVTAVFAVNLTICAFVWRGWKSGYWIKTLKNFYNTFLPTFLMIIPCIVMVVYYVLTYDLEISVARRRDYIPEPISYVFPFTLTSIYSDLISAFFIPKGHEFDIVRTELARIDLACYLGLLVLPLCVVGMILWRREATIKFCIFIFIFFLVLSMGPRLLLFREITHIGQFGIILPFALWREIPIIGSIPQSGRYLVITYMMMGVGVSCLITTLRNYCGHRLFIALAIMCGILVCADFAFKPITSKLPPIPKISGMDGVVLDPRFPSGHTMYYQTYHQRPLVGGYINRKPGRALQLYRDTPGFQWLFFGDQSAPHEKYDLIKSLNTLNITDIMLNPGDWREVVLEKYGFVRFYEDSFTVVWAVPGA